MRRKVRNQNPKTGALCVRPAFCVLHLSLSLAVFTLFLVSLSLAESTPRPAFDADRAFEYLRKQCEFGPRPPGSAAHEQTRDYLAAELRKFAREVVNQKFTYQSGDGPLEMTNIIASFGPKSGKKVLLAAHWDTRPFADRDPKPENRHLPILGANDGASGVAILLELSRIFHSNPPDTQVIVVLFDGEDYGKTSDSMYLGSKYFAKNMEDRWKPEYGIVVDMVGDKDLDICVEPFSAEAAPEIVKKVWNLARDLRLRGIHRELGPAVTDDHIPLIESGIKCIDIIDFNYAYWHTIEDTPDKCSPESLGTVGKLLLELVYSQ